MIDLAGSDRDWREEEEDKRAGSLLAQQGRDYEVEKQEMKMIRKSLSTLGYIIKELSRGVSAKGLPYRDSVLTWLLKGALTGQCHMTMISTISPSHSCYDETLSTLKYVRRLYQQNKKLSEPRSPSQNHNFYFVDYSIITKILLGIQKQIVTPAASKMWQNAKKRLQRSK